MVFEIRIQLQCLSWVFLWVRWSFPMRVTTKPWSKGLISVFNTLLKTGGVLHHLHVGVFHTASLALFLVHGRTLILLELLLFLLPSSSAPPHFSALRELWQLWAALAMGTAASKTRCEPTVPGLCWALEAAVTQQQHPKPPGDTNCSSVLTGKQHDENPMVLT